MKRSRRLLGAADEDPLAGLANLFDTGLVFAVGLLVAAVGATALREAAADPGGSPLLRYHRHRRFLSFDRSGYRHTKPWRLSLL